MRPEWKAATTPWSELISSRFCRLPLNRHGLADAADRRYAASGFALSPIAPLSWAAVVGCRTGANRLGPPPSCGDVQSDAKSLSSCPRTRVSQIVTVFSDL